MINPPILEKDFKTLVLKLNPVQAKWRSLGIALKVQHYDLDAIEKNAGNYGVQRMLEDMLNQWMNSEQTRTWPEIVEALCNPTISERGLAKNIRDDHCQDYHLPPKQQFLLQTPPHITPPPITTPTPPPAQITPPPPPPIPRPCDKRKL